MLCAGLCAAQRGGGRRGGHVSRAESEDQIIDLFKFLLNLKDPQPQKLRDVLDLAIQEAILIPKSGDADKDSLLKAATSGKTDEEIGKIAVEQAKISSQMMALQSRTFGKIYRLMTSDQQAKMDSFLYDRLGSFLESGPPSPAPTPPATPKQ
jgi:hypothetical protein